MERQLATTLLIAAGHPPDLSPLARTRFLDACTKGPTSVVQAYLALGMDPNVRQEIFAYTPLIRAAEGGNVERLELLLSHGAALELRDSSGDTALRTALNWNRPDAVRLLHSRGADLRAIHPIMGDDTMTRAIHSGHEDNFKLLLELGADPNVRALAIVDRPGWIALAIARGMKWEKPVTDEGATALHLLVRQQRESDIVLALLDGASPRVLDRYGVSPRDYALEVCAPGDALYAAMGFDADPPMARELALQSVWQAAAKKQFALAMELAKSSGFSLTIRNRLHQTLLAVACQLGDVDAVDALLAAGCEPSPDGPWDCKPLYAAMLRSDLATVQRLIAAGASVLGPDGKIIGLHDALWNERAELVHALLEALGEQRVSESHWAELLSAVVIRQNLSLLKALHTHGAMLDAHFAFGGETALHSACTHYPKLEMIEYLLTHGADPNVRSDDGCTPLHQAACYSAHGEHFVEVVRLLHKHGARLDVADVYGRTPFTVASQENKLAFCKVLVEEPLAENAALDAHVHRQNWGTLPVWYAAGKHDEVRFFVGAGVAFEPPRETLSSPLLDAVVGQGDSVMLEFLLARPVVVDRVRFDGSTVLVDALRGGSVECTRLLLEHGANPSIADHAQCTPLHFASTDVELLKLLVQYGADPKAGVVGTPLFYAAHFGDPASVKFLLEHGANPNARDGKWQTPLSVAVVNNHAEAVQLLVDSGADATALVGEAREYLLAVAVQKGNSAVVRSLINAGASLDALSPEGQSVLSLLLERKRLCADLADLLIGYGYDATQPTRARLPDDLLSLSEWWSAVYSGDSETLQKLLKNGQDPNERDLYGETALMHFVECNDVSLVQLMIDGGADVRAVSARGWPVASYLARARAERVSAVLEQSAGGPLLSMAVLEAQAERVQQRQAIVESIELGQLGALEKRILARELNPHQAWAGASLLTLAIDYGQDEVLEFLVDLGLSVQRADLRGLNALEYAAQFGRDEFVARHSVGE